MSKHTPFDPALVERPEQKSEPPEPTHSQRRARQQVMADSESAAPKSAAPSGSAERPSRPSARPSAFGAPRVSRTGEHPTAQLAVPPPRESLSPNAQRASADHEEYDRDADTAPGLTIRSLTAPPLQLVLARTSLPDAPSIMLVTAPETPSREEPRRALTSIAVFAVMLCATAVPLTRYALKSSAEEPQGSTHAAVRRIEPRAAPVPPNPPAGPVARSGATSPSAARLAIEAQPARIDRLPGIMAGLPAEASVACEYLVDHAVRARDSNELQLAETLLGRASELDDRNPHPAFALAKLRFEQGNYEGAEGWIVNAIRLRPRRAEYRILYANILARLGRENEARDERRKTQRFKD